MKLTRKSFIQKIGVLGASISVMPKLLGEKSIGFPPPVCTLVPAETLGPFPSLPSGDSMYWRSDIIDGQAGVTLNFTIKVRGDNNCGIMVNHRVDVWHCNAHGYYSHYAAGGMNNGHSGANSPGSTNGSLIYCRGSQVTNANGEVTFTSIFPGWYPGRTDHIHIAIYAGGTVGAPSGWVEQRVSQFTFPIAEKNVLLTSQSPYSSYGADPLVPANDNVFSTPSGAWALYQLGTLAGSGSGPYDSYFELAIDATGLPLDLIGFDGALHNNGAVLWWKTASEINFSHFEIEYGLDGEDFETIGKVEAVGNNTNTTNNYKFEDIDRLLYGNAYYRLKMVDLDGTFKYSARVVITFNHDLPLKVYPSPATDHINISHPFTKGGEQIMIMDAKGKAIAVGNLTERSSQTRVSLELLNSGLHFLVFANGQNNQTIKFVKE